jgi:asparagine synthase (glutamine-hydrolysing)
MKEDLVRRTVPRFLLQTINSAVSGRNGTLMHKACSLTESALSNPGRAYYRTNTFISDADLDSLLSVPLRTLCRGYDPADHTLKYWNRLQGADHLTRMLYTDIKTYLPGDILAKVDRMSMAHSLEVRAPLLDYRVVEFAASLPSNLKIRGNNKKRLLKNAFEPYLPARIINRRKHGFTVPLDNWFRRDLVPLCDKYLLQNDPLADFFSLPRIRHLWKEHQEHKANHGTLLWSLLSFSLWQQEYLQV